ncbi:sugar phosphate nucleotidyltransferase [Patescibacteria group bacterium]|nr:sugar phosphate nucleotidyltransferase [Patescibacteria group bacterium]
MAAVSENHHFLVILCGGTGPRLWPLSTSRQPKQFLKIDSTKTLLEETIARCRNLVPKGHLYIVSNKIYAAKLKKFREHVLLEPERKNTTTAILYATSVISKIDPQAIITTTPADHFVAGLESFRSCLQSAYHQAQRGTIVTIGITPTSPNPSYGYIKISGHRTPYPVIRFIEKPKKSLCRRLISNPQWFWNSGIYTFSLSSLKHSLSIHSPKYHQIFQQLLRSDSPTSLARIYHQSPHLAFDYVVSERSHNLTMIPATFSWSDVGEWQSIYQLLSKDQNQIATFNQQTPYISIDSSTCLLSGNPQKLIGLIGVSNLAIIDTPAGLLVCQLPLSAKVRDLVATIVADQKTKHFFER